MYRQQAPATAFVAEFRMYRTHRSTEERSQKAKLWCREPGMGTEWRRRCQQVALARSMMQVRVLLRQAEVTALRLLEAVLVGPSMILNRNPFAAS